MLRARICASPWVLWKASFSHPRIESHLSHRLLSNTEMGLSLAAHSIQKTASLDVCKCHSNPEMPAARSIKSLSSRTIRLLYAAVQLSSRREAVDLHVAHLPCNTVLDLVLLGKEPTSWPEKPTCSAYVVCSHRRLRDTTGLINIICASKFLSCSMSISCSLSYLSLHERSSTFLL